MTSQCDSLVQKASLDEDYDQVKFGNMVKYWIKCCEHIPLKDVDYRIIQLVSQYFPPQHDWKVTLAASLGVHSVHVLDVIEGHALVNKKWPSEILLKYCMDNTSLTFGDVLLELYGTLRRCDCLQALYDRGYILEFLKDWDEKEKSLLLVPSEQKLLSIKAVSQPLVANDLIIQNLKLSSPEDVLKVLDAMKPTSVRTLNANNVKTDYTGYNDQPSNGQIIERVPNNTLATNGVRKKKLVILLTYSKDAKSIVPELVQHFWAAGCGVICEHVLQGKGYFELNFVEAWERFFKQSRFVVPIISEHYLEDIRQPSDDINSQGVRFVYDLYTRRYIRDGCRNHLVRPLVMNGMPTSLMNRIGLNPTLEIRWQLPEELTSFLDMIKKYSVRFVNDQL